jgi:hypothetical protein
MERKAEVVDVVPLVITVPVTTVQPRPEDAPAVARARNEPVSVSIGQHPQPLTPKPAA